MKLVYRVSLSAVMMVVGFAILATFFPNDAHADISPERRAQGIQTLEKALEKSFIRSLQRDTIVYHYSARGPWFDQTQGALSSQFIDHMQGATNSYFDLQKSVDQSRDANRSGMYAAQDPRVSRSRFGGADWLMFAITLPTGTRILHASFGTVDRSAFAGIPECAGGDWHLFELLIRKGNASRECLSTMNEVLKQMKIGAIAYTWEADTFGQFSGTINGDECQTTGDAFVVLSHESVPSPNFLVYTRATQSADDNPELRSMLSIWDPTLWPELSRASTPRDSAKGAANAVLNSWMQEHNYSCTGF